MIEEIKIGDTVSFEHDCFGHMEGTVEDINDGYSYLVMCSDGFQYDCRLNELTFISKENGC